VKCVNCGKDSNYKDRTGKQCGHCKKAFAFEPKDGDKVTDMMFKNAIAAVSGEGRVRWGVEHLYYEVCRKKSNAMRAPLGCVLASLCLLTFCVVAGCVLQVKQAAYLFPFAFFAFIGLVASSLSRIRKRTVPIEKEEFNRYWTRWANVMGKPAGLIERAADNRPVEPLEDDIADYSFDRAVICDRARTVDLLVANNFHFENNCAVLSFDGYPKGVFGVIRAMLKKNPKLQVFVLHDATPNGCALATKLITDPHWFGGSGLRVIDLGLRPRHAKPFKGLYLPGVGAKPTGEPGVTPDEAAWLWKYNLELAAARPEQVLKRLFAGLMAHANDDPRTGDTGGAVMTCGAFEAGGYGGDAGGEGGSDAFG
jgi:hypothetical protein